MELSCCDTHVQADVEGQKITWITPHALQQVLTDDVDFNVMLTFLEFYEVIVVQLPSVSMLDPNTNLVLFLIERLH